MRPRRLPKPYTQAELNALAPVLARRPALESCCVFLSETGLRSAEFSAITSEEARSWPVPRWWCSLFRGRFCRHRAFLRFSGKGGVERVVPLSYAALRAAPRILEHSRNGHLSPWSERGLRHAMQVAGEEAGVHHHPHRYRHTFGTRLIDAGVDAYTVADLMGHADLSTTKLYTKLSEDRLRRAVRPR